MLFRSQIKKPELASAGRDSSVLRVVGAGCLRLLPCSPDDGHSGGFVFGAGGNRAAVPLVPTCPRSCWGVHAGEPALRPVTPSRRSAQLLLHPLRWWPPSGDFSLLFRAHCRHSGRGCLLPLSFAPSFQPCVQKRRVKCLIRFRHCLRR